MVVVETMLRNLCSERNLTISKLVWNEDFDRLRYWLRVEASGRQVAWPFSYEQLEDCVENKSVWQKIEAAMATFVLPTHDNATVEPLAAVLEDVGVHTEINQQQPENTKSKTESELEQESEPEQTSEAEPPRWTRSERIAFWGVILTLGCFVAGLFALPEVRQWVGLGKPAPMIADVPRNETQSTDASGDVQSQLKNAKDSSGNPANSGTVHKQPTTGIPQIEATKVPKLKSPHFILESDFNDEVLKAAQPVLVLFCTDYREPCPAMLPTIASIGQEYSDKLKVVAIDVRINRNIPENYSADYFKVPVTVLFKGGTELGRIVGAASKQSIVHLIENPQNFAIIQKPNPATHPVDPLDAIPTVPESDFNDQVLRAKVPVLVYFYATYVEACKEVTPVVAQVATSRAGSLKVLRVDSHVQGNVAEKYHAQSFATPVLILFKDGEARGLIKGTTSLDALIHLVDHPQDFAIEKGRSERETPPSVSVTLAAIPNVLESDFSESIKSAVVPILVYFYNDSDRTCMVTAPTVAEIAGIYKGKVNVLKIDTSINRLIPYRYGNAGSWGPTFLVFKHGKVKGRLDGAFSKEGAVRMIDKALAGK